MKKMKIALLIILLVLLSLLGVSTGAVDIPLSTLFSIPSSPEAYILLQLRIPRVISAILTGGILALSGLVFQSVFRNPMADSYLLGVSSGASFSVVLSALIVPSFIFSMYLPFFAFFGALLTALVVLLIAKKEPNSLILSGIALNLLLSSFTALLLFVFHSRTESVLFWSLGSFASSSFHGVSYLITALLLLFLFTFFSADKLDILLLDESTAYSMGVDVNRTKLVMLVVSSLATAVAVSLSGIIGFVGLMSPHIAKSIVGAKHRRVIPLSMLLGSIIMLSSDLLARTLARPTEIPVGIITSILGVPLFLLLVRRRRYR